MGIKTHLIISVLIGGQGGDLSLTSFNTLFFEKPGANLQIFNCKEKVQQRLHPVSDTWAGLNLA